MKKLALHWWILIGMLAGVLFGIVAAQLDARRAEEFLANNPEVASAMEFSKDLVLLLEIVDDFLLLASKST